MLETSEGFGHRGFRGPGGGRVRDARPSLRLPAGWSVWVSELRAVCVSSPRAPVHPRKALCCCSQPELWGPCGGRAVPGLGGALRAAAARPDLTWLRTEAQAGGFRAAGPGSPASFPGAPGRVGTQLSAGLGGQRWAPDGLTGCPPCVPRRGGHGLSWRRPASDQVRTGVAPPPCPQGHWWRPRAGLDP